MTYLLMTEIAVTPDASGKYRAKVSGMPEGCTIQDALDYAKVDGRVNATISETVNRTFWEESRNPHIFGYAEENSPGAYVSYYQNWVD